MTSKDFNKIAENYLAVVINHLGKKYNQLPSVLKLCGDVKGKDILDIGCGSGYYSELFKRKGASRVVGIDVSKEQIRLARQRAHSQKLEIEYITGDAFNFDFSRLGKFNMILAVFSLFYANSIEELGNALFNIKKALVTDGIFLALVENPEDPLVEDERVKYGAKITSKKRKLVDGDRLKIELFDIDGKKICKFISNYYSKETYEKALKKAGFKQIFWSRPVISEEGLEKYGKEFWDAMEKNPTFMCVKAK